jgi:uncharacterized protein with HEPN domain
MKKRKIDDYLQDILDAITAIEKFTQDVNFKQFYDNLGNLESPSPVGKFLKIPP